jgi:hypothetical protein
MLLRLGLRLIAFEVRSGYGRNMSGRKLSWLIFRDAACHRLGGVSVDEHRGAEDRPVQIRD